MDDGEIQKNIQAMSGKKATWSGFLFWAVIFACYIVFGCAIYHVWCEFWN